MSPNSGHPPLARIALFIDVENFIARVAALGLPIDFARIVEECKKIGRVQIRRSYGDLVKCLTMIGRQKEFFAVRQMLTQNLVQIEDVPYQTSAKNTADIRLVVEALSLAYQESQITHFAIVASDRDYVPLCNKLRELGREVIIVAADSPNVPPVLREAADRLIYYEGLFDMPQPSATADEEPQSATATLAEAYRRALIQSIRTIEERGQSPLGSNVVAQLRMLRSDFDPKQIGYDSFRKFAEAMDAQGVVEMRWPRGTASDFELVLRPGVELPARPVTAVPGLIAAGNGAVIGDVIAKSNGNGESGGASRSGGGLGAGAGGGTARTASGIPIATATPVEVDRGEKHLAEQYQKIISEKLKVPFPSPELRQAIYKGLAESYNSLMKNGAFYLADWSQTCELKLRSNVGGVRPTESQIFKLLLSIRYARCLSIQIDESGGPSNPLVIGLTCKPEEWEEKLREWFIKTLSNEKPRAELTPRALSLFFTGKAEKDVVEAMGSKLLEMGLAG